MNSVVIMGRLVRDPDVRYTQGQDSFPVASFTLAVDRREKPKPDGTRQADFISCVAFRKTAELIEKYFTKGQRMLVHGRIQTGSYTNREGKKVYTTDVVVEEIDFIESKSDSSQGVTENSWGGPEAAGEPEARQGSLDDFMDIPDALDDDGLPFA